MIIVKNRENTENIIVSNSFDVKPKRYSALILTTDAQKTLYSFLFEDRTPHREYISFPFEYIQDIEDGEYILKLDGKNHQIITRMRIGDYNHTNETPQLIIKHNTEEDIFYEN